MFHATQLLQSLLFVYDVCSISNNQQWLWNVTRTGWDVGEFSRMYGLNTWAPGGRSNTWTRDRQFGTVEIDSRAIRHCGNVGDKTRGYCGAAGLKYSLGEFAIREATAKPVNPNSTLDVVVASFSGLRVSAVNAGCVVVVCVIFFRTDDKPKGKYVLMCET